MLRRFGLVFVCAFLASSAAAQARKELPFGIDSADIPYATRASVEPVSQDATPLYWWGFHTGDAVTPTVIFSSGDLRIAAKCPECGRIPPMQAWIALRRDLRSLDVIFENPKKPMKREKATRVLSSKWVLRAAIWEIVQVRNVKTGESFPKSMDELMKK
jgi:hypothetical protein